MKALKTIPANVAYDDNYLYIEWRDGQECRYEHSVLRASCPCADCRDKPLRPESFIETSVSDYGYVGNYALNITWTDGHNTGIYTYKMLRDFCDTAAEVKKP